MKDEYLLILIFLLYFSPVFYHSYLAIKEYKNNNKEPLRRLKKFFKYTLIVTFFTIGIFATLSHTNFLNYEKPMTYDKIDAITFENFRGLEFFKKSLYGNKRFAYVVTSIEYEIEGDEVLVQSYFHPSRSFVYNTHTNSRELLTHEKYHIKITELYTRKIKEELSNLSSSADIEKTIQTGKEEERTFQKQYDYDTFHSYVYSEQIRYQKEVDSLLDLLKGYKNSKTKINAKN